MSVDTVFYIVGLTVTALALLVSFAGLKVKDFPSKGALRGLLGLFAVLVVLTGGLAIAVAREEQDHRRAEQAETAKVTEESEENGTADEDAVAETGDDTEGATGDAEAASGPGSTIELAADPSALAYDQTEMESPPGKITINLDNPAPIPHDVAIREGDDGETLFASEVVTESTTVAEGELAPGTYTFFCSVPGHEQAGMVGTLTVK